MCYSFQFKIGVHLLNVELLQLLTLEIDTTFIDRPSFRIFYKSSATKTSKHYTVWHPPPCRQPPSQHLPRLLKRGGGRRPAARRDIGRWLGECRHSPPASLSIFRGCCSTAEAGGARCDIGRWRGECRQRPRHRSLPRRQPPSASSEAAGGAA